MAFNFGAQPAFGAQGQAASGPPIPNFGFGAAAQPPPLSLPGTALGQTAPFTTGIGGAPPFAAASSSAAPFGFPSTAPSATANIFGTAGGLGVTAPLSFGASSAAASTSGVGGMFGSSAFGGGFAAGTSAGGVPIAFQNTNNVFNQPLQQQQQQQPHVAAVKRDPNLVEVVRHQCLQLHQRHFYHHLNQVQTRSHGIFSSKNALPAK
jgi:hypothetical protein